MNNSIESKIEVYEKVFGTQISWMGVGLVLTHPY